MHAGHEGGVGFEELEVQGDEVEWEEQSSYAGGGLEEEDGEVAGHEVEGEEAAVFGG